MDKKAKKDKKERKSRRKDAEEICEAGALPRSRYPSASVGVPVDQMLRRHGIGITQAGRGRGPALTSRRLLAQWPAASDVSGSMEPGQ